MEPSSRAEFLSATLPIIALLIALTGSGAALAAECDGVPEGQPCATITAGTCEGGICVVPAVIARGRIKQQRDGQGNGSVWMRGEIQVHPPAEDWNPSSGFDLRVTDGNFVYTKHWEPGDCVIFQTSGMIRCIPVVGKGKIRFKPDPLVPDLWDLVVRIKGAAVDPPFGTTVTVEISRTGAGEMHRSVIDTCVVKVSAKNGTEKIDCHPRYAP
jgi:hypothetical protein